MLSGPQYAQPQYSRAPDQTGSIPPGYVTSQPLPPPQSYSQPGYTQPQAQMQPLPPPIYSQQPTAPVYPQQTYAPPPVQQTYHPPVYSQAPAYPQQQAVLKPAPVVTTGPRVASLTPPPPPAITGPRKANTPLVTGSTTAPAPVANVPQAPAPGWSTTGGTYVALKQGETISSLSQRYGVPVKAIMSANNFADATRVQPGQQVLIPTYVYGNVTQPAQQMPPAVLPTRTSNVMQPPPAVAPAPSLLKGGEHVVRKGETIELIARTYGIPVSKLRAANHMAANSAIRPGQKLSIPLIGGQHVAQTPVPVAPATPVVPLKTAAATPAPATLGVVPANPAQPAETKVASVQPDAATLKPSAALAVEPKMQPESPRSEAKTAAAPSFRWPVRGRVIADFGTKPGGDRNDGINLAVPEGTSVKSAEDGEVVYAGNELKGYGNVVLVKHADGWVTVYAHASDLLVNKGDHVTRGQIIARAGATGNVTQPQLHFELRKGQKPIDPKSFLTN
ncbi:MAG: peptidoglycan DD-metalloendopeptidase family protein [Ancalomicrobiaceae bacterium]|nr:peptidoglycan DD-metalloendopeptidase family protein [Ancalomicrobiaceae bacterium]